MVLVVVVGGRNLRDDCEKKGNNVKNDVLVREANKGTLRCSDYRSDNCNDDNDDSNEIMIITMTTMSKKIYQEKKTI